MVTHVIMLPNWKLFRFTRECTSAAAGSPEKPTQKCENWLEEEGRKTEKYETKENETAAIRIAVPLHLGGLYD